jgi:ATP-dependent Lon protease
MTDENNYPVVPLKGTVLFPEHILPFAVENTRTLRAVEAAASGQGKVFVVAVRNDVNKETPGKYYEMGVIAQVGLSQRGPGDMPMILQGIQRARVSEYNLD